MNDNNNFKVRLSWSFYDWANSAWSAMIITFVFSRYFVDVLSPDKDTGTLFWTWTIGISSLVAALLSPIIGSISDQTQNSRYWLLITTIIYSLISFLFWFAAPNILSISLIILLVFIGNLSYEISQIFYNGQLKLITNKDNYAKLSGFAWGLGYVGTVLIFIIYYGLFLFPEDPLFALDASTYENIRISFPITGFWIILFSIPLFFTFKDPNYAGKDIRLDIKKSFSNILITLQNIKKYKNLFTFLIARLFYMDGINAIFAVAAIYATFVFGMSTTEIIFLGIGTNIAAGLGSWIFSLIEKNFGSKNVIVLSLIFIFIICIIILMVSDKNLFLILAVLLSSFFGPVQSASRVYFIINIPDEKKYEFFGFYSFSGKVTSFLGPVLFGTITYIFSSHRIGMASLLVLFAIGLLIVLRVENDFKKK